MSTTPTKTPSKAGESTFTPRDLELLGKAMLCNKNEVQIDNDKFAELAGFKNGNSARVAWHGLKKKLERVSNVAADGTETIAFAGEAEKAPKTPAKKRKSAAANGDEGDAPKTTTASGKKRKSSADEGEEATPTKPTPAKKGGRKPRGKPKAAVAAAADEEETMVKKEDESGEGDADKEKGDTDKEAGEADKEEEQKEKNGESIKEEIDDA